MRRILLLLTTLLATAVMAGAMPYDPAADARQEISQALVAGKASGMPVLVILGANWCEDCRALDAAMHSGKNAELIPRRFKVVKVDVGNFDRNLDVSAAYGNPIKKGIPAAVVLSSGNLVLYATHGGELADARRMSETGIYDFFTRVYESTRKRQM